VKRCEPDFLLEKLLTAPVQLRYGLDAALVELGFKLGQVKLGDKLLQTLKP